MDLHAQCNTTPVIAGARDAIWQDSLPRGTPAWPDGLVIVFHCAVALVACATDIMRWAGGRLSSSLLPSSTPICWQLASAFAAWPVDGSCAFERGAVLANSVTFEISEVFWRSAAPTFPLLLGGGVWADIHSTLPAHMYSDGQVVLRSTLGKCLAVLRCFPAVPVQCC